MASIDTEFKADLARIEMRLYDLAKLANTLDECFNDIGGVQKRIKISFLGDTASEAEKEGLQLPLRPPRRTRRYKYVQRLRQ